MRLSQTPGRGLAERLLLAGSGRTRLDEWQIK
jgi:hypothetical protein